MTNKIKFWSYRFSVFIAIIVIYTQSVFSNPVDVATASSLATQFYQRYLQKDKSIQANVRSVNTIQKDGFQLLHVFNFDKGFVITSANDAFTPIIAYSNEDFFPVENTPEVINFWMRQYTEPMLNKLKTSQYLARHPKWDILTTQFLNKTNPLISGVDPLLTSKWDQGQWYNDSCPAISTGPNGRCYAGCVATTLGQIMYYHKYPETGNGVHSYQHPHFGDIAVNYGNTTYDWSAMGNNANLNTRGEISKLIYHCGVSVDMNYGPSGSGSQSELALNSFIEHFNYRTDARYIERSAFGIFEWRRKIIDNLYSEMPVLYSGSDGGAGHAWVCDGVNDSLYFHMNWGWSGAGNGFFLLDSLDSGNGNFSGYQSAVINIAPFNKPYCFQDKEYYENEVIFNDGSSLSLYKNNSDCRYIIHTDSFRIRINFNYFDTEENIDILNIYNGEDVNAPLLGSYSGSNLPPVLYSTGNSVYLQFISNDTIQKQGWELRYIRVTPAEIDKNGAIENSELSLSPNPTNDIVKFSLKSNSENDVQYSLLDISGRVIEQGNLQQKGNNVFEFNVSHLKNGVYFLKIDTKQSSQLGKIIKI